MSEQERAPRFPRWDLIVLAALFVVTRAGARLAGVRFDAEPLTRFYQFLDPELLRTDLARSLANLHMQPPGLNAIVGGALKLDGGGTALLPWIWIAFGAAAVAALHALLLRLRVHRGVATTLSALYLASPAAILYENHLFYTLPTAAFLAVGAWLLHRFLSGDRTRDGVGAFLCFAAAAMTRSLFHVVWLLAIVAIVVLFRPGRRQRVLAVAGVPVLLVIAWYARTFVMFGSFAASTWFGMNFAKITLAQGPHRDRAAMVRSGALSPLALIPPFRDLGVYRDYLPDSPDRGVPALDEPEKTNGRRNLNHAGYIEISRLYLAEDLIVLRERPGWYARGVGTAMMNSFYPASGGEFLEVNRRHIRGWRALYAPVHAGRNAGVILLFAASVAGAVAASVRALRAGRLGEPDDLTIAVLAGTVVWVFLVGNLFDVGENYRFRFLTFPAQFALAGVLLERLRRRISRPGELRP